MQQLIDLLLFIASYSVIVYWIVRVFKHSGNKTLSLRLTKKQVITLLITEIVLFALMYANYFAHESLDVADSFSWHYSITYARGVLPIAGLASLSDKAFNLKDPVFICLVACLIMDYVILFISTKIADLIKGK